MAHITRLWTEPLEAAIGQRIYAIALGIFHAYLLERSRSLLAPIIAHSASDFDKTVLQILWVSPASVRPLAKQRQVFLGFEHESVSSPLISVPPNSTASQILRSDCSFAARTSREMAC
ncbi:MAG: CPBP family intramembrane glutamic endopeptidase, partial [Rhizomicrobium sp.]